MSHVFHCCTRHAFGTESYPYTAKFSVDKVHYGELFSISACCHHCHSAFTNMQHKLITRSAILYIKMK